MGCFSRSTIDIESTGRVNKADVISSLQQSGEATYDLARETLKSVSVDASGKVELEDYVEVRHYLSFLPSPFYQEDFADAMGRSCRVLSWCRNCAHRKPRMSW